MAGAAGGHRVVALTGWGSGKGHVCVYVCGVGGQEGGRDGGWRWKSPGFSLFGHPPNFIFAIRNNLGASK